MEAELNPIGGGKNVMNYQEINKATIKKWEAIASDQSNHALIVYERLDGGTAVDVFEILSVHTNRQGILCLYALSLGAKHHAAGNFVSTSVLPDSVERNRVVAIPLNTILESHRYEYGIELNDFNNYKYHETVARARVRLAKINSSEPMTRPDSSHVTFEIGENKFPDLLYARLGCMIWLLYAVALIALVSWIL